MAKKGNRVQVILECSEHKDSGLPGASRYITTKNKKNSTNRLELKKYNPKGKFKASVDEVKNYLKEYENVHIYKGIFPNSSDPIKNKKFS